MHIQSNLEINFHEQYSASVFLENSASNREEKFGEILLFSLFTIRTLVNLGGDPSASALALLLSKEVPENLEKITTQKEDNAANLVDYTGVKGRKRFISQLNCTDENLNFKYDTNGFGFFASGMGYYAPNSVIILLKYLAKKRDDSEYRQGLERAAMQCGLLYFDKKLTLSGQNQIAFLVALQSYEYNEEVQ